MQNRGKSKCLITQSMINEKKTQRRGDILATWFQPPKRTKSKLPKSLFGTSMKREIVDFLVLLVRIKGHEEVLNFIKHHFFLVQTICAYGQCIGSAQIICDELCSWLNSTRAFQQFYMSSFLIYILAAIHLWVGLTSIEDINEETKVYEFYASLQLDKSYEEYVKMNDAYTMRLCRDIQGCPERRFSLEAIWAIAQFG